MSDHSQDDWQILTSIGVNKVPHQIIKPRQGTHNIPDWTKDDRKVREVLLRSFPKLNNDDRHRKSAARWIRIIHLYFRMNMPRAQVLQEMRNEGGQEKVSITLKQVSKIIERIRNAGNGLSTNGRARRSRGGHRQGSGRPRAQSSAVITK
jgi:hypothetical protein